MPNPTPTFAIDPLLSGNLAELYIRIGGDVTAVALYKVPLASDLSFTLNGQTEQVGIYSEAFDRAAKNGLSGSFTAEVRGSPRDAVIKALMDAATSQGQAANGTFIFIRGPRDAWSGNLIVSGVQSSDPVRGAAAYTITFETTGALEYEQDADSTINTSVTMATDVGTVVCTAHGFVVGQTIQLYGVSTELDNTGEINGVYVIQTSADANTFTIDTVGVDDGAAATPGFSTFNL
jgi:hypothetical protein